MKEPLISVIIVNWNGERIIGKCLASLRKQSYKKIEIIVVDNNSEDESRDIITEKFKDVVLIRSKKNLGFAEGNNVGLKQANGEFVLLLNSDAIITKKTIKQLLQSIQEDDKLGIVQPKILYRANENHLDNTINSVGTFLTNTGFLYYPGYGKSDNNENYNKTKYIFSAYGACMLIKKDVINQIGLFDPDYFMYFEETDFCMRAWLSGWKIMYIPNASVYHTGGVSSRKFGTDKVYFHSFKNKICTYMKNFQTQSLFLILSIHIILCFAISLLYLLTKRPRYALAVQKAIIWNVTNLKKTLKKRKKVQKKLRKISDKEYLNRVLFNPPLKYYLYLFTGLEYYKD
jgi:GT2 family glycosyltransferase